MEELVSVSLGDPQALLQKVKPGQWNDYWILARGGFELTPASLATDDAVPPAGNDLEQVNRARHVVFPPPYLVLVFTSNSILTSSADSARS